MSRTDTLSIEFFLNRLAPLADTSRACGTLPLAPIRRGQGDGYFVANPAANECEAPCQRLPGRESFLNALGLDWLDSCPQKDDMMRELGFLMMEIAQAQSQAEDDKRQAGDLIYPLY